MMQMALRGLLALLFTSEVFAAALTAAPEWNEKAQRAALQHRQASTPTGYSYVYYSNGEDTSSGTTETICKLSWTIYSYASLLTHGRRGALDILHIASGISEYHR